MSTALVLKNSDAFTRIGEIQSEALSLLGDASVPEMQKTYVAACAIAQIKSALTDDVMRPIMALQGSGLGFKTDRDRDGGYDTETVRNVATTALVSGLRLHGNEINIIGGNCYVALAGCERLFNELCAEPPQHDWDGIAYDENARRATCKYRIKYRLKGDQQERTREMQFAVKLQYSRDGKFLITTDDAILGKARRKMLWSLLRELRGIELGEGEIERGTEKNVTPRATSVEAKPFAVEETP